MLFLITVTLGILVLDAFMKENKADEDEDGAIELNKMLLERSTQWTEFGILNEYNGDFGLKKSVRWINFIYLVIIELFLVFRCL